MNTLSRTWTIQQQLWKWALILITLTLCITTYHVKASKANFYDKAKESRRGSLRKAREGKDILQIKQERLGVTRSIWLQDPSGERRQFFIEADRAEGGASINGKSSSFKETFFQPKGWFQEELFWELHGEKVVQKGKNWIFESHPERTISKSQYPQIQPVQHVRFFDSETAEWDPDNNRLLAHQTSFCILKTKSHLLPKNFSQGTVVAKGTARTMNFSFDAHQTVSCQGAKFQLHPGIAL